MLLREVAKKVIFLKYVATKLEGGGGGVNGRTTKKKENFLKLEKKSKKMWPLSPREGGGRKGLSGLATRIITFFAASLTQKKEHTENSVKYTMFIDSKYDKNEKISFCQKESFFFNSNKNSVKICNVLFFPPRLVLLSS